MEGIVAGFSSSVCAVAVIKIRSVMKPFTLTHIEESLLHTTADQNFPVVLLVIKTRYLASITYNHREQLQVNAPHSLNIYRRVQHFRR